MKQIITSTIHRVINKTMKGFSAIMVEDHITVKGLNQFLDISVSIRDGEVLIEIDNNYYKYTMGYEMDISLEELVSYVITDVRHIDKNNG